MHRCRTSDGMTIGCICTTGRDHDEDEMDQPDSPPTSAHCCVDAEASAMHDREIVHTAGCANRCAVLVALAPAPPGELWPSSYPCGITKDHDGRHWVHPTYRAAEGS